MAITDQIKKMERDLDQIGLTAADLCGEADISPVTWWRWRTGEFMPRMSKWMLVEEAFARITGAK